jgi:hypothetical protein
VQNEKKQTDSFFDLWRLTMAARNWTPEQREAQAQRIRQYKPWELSTGAKTSKGKRKVARNGIKHGCSVRMTREAYISLIRSMCPALADDSELIESMVNKLKFSEVAATNEDDLKPIIRQLTRAQSLIKKSKRIVWTIGDVDAARKHIDPMVDELLSVSSCIMDTCELLIKLAKKLEAETKGDPLQVTKIPPSVFENLNK